MLRNWSWGSNEFSIIVMGAAPVLAPFIREIEYNDAVDTELVYAAGRDPLGTTDPIYKPGDGSIQVLAREWRVFIQSITGGGALRVTDLDYALNIKRKLQTIPIPITDRVDFVIKSSGDSNAQGSAEALNSVIAIQVVNATRNGVHL